MWLLEECKNVDWDVKIYKRKADMLAPEDLKKVSPLGKSPVVEVSSSATTKPLILSESGFITEYLADHFAQQLVPKKYEEGKEGVPGGETESWRRYHYYLHYAEGTLMPMLMLAFIMESECCRFVAKRWQVADARTDINSQAPFFVRPVTKIITSRVDDAMITHNAEKNFNMLEDQLATSPGNGKYLCGPELTAADILMSFPLIAAKSRLNMKTYPKLNEYIKLLETSAGYASSVKKLEELTGEPFSPML